jgi:hypothetical protein
MLNFCWFSFVEEGPDWPQTHDLPTLASQVLELRACATTLSYTAAFSALGAEKHLFST